MNAIMLVGHLPADARGSKTSTGDGYGLVFTVSVADYVRTDSALLERPMFFECAFVGKKAERLEPALRRGARVAVRGRVVTGPLDESEKLICADDIEVLGPAK